MQDAENRFNAANAYRSQTFKQTVEKYRRKYGRHPPPGFKQWYIFARERHVYNVDDFDQINDDLRPFWAVPPHVIRHYAAHASDIDEHLVSTISVRTGQVFQELWGWRSETFVKGLQSFAHLLPDMDIPMNRMDQPRVLVPWDELQTMLEKEASTRSTRHEGNSDQFTPDMPGFWRRSPRTPEPAWLYKLDPFWSPREHNEDPDDPPPDYGWFWHAAQPLMDIAAKACPPGTYARNAQSVSHLDAAEAHYKTALGGFVSNFNLSSDLCTVGPQLADLHGFLFASTSMIATHKLVPIFSESKTNVNNDILFPANMYMAHDERYQYSDESEINWDDKDDNAVWRGATSSGTAFEDQPDAWKRMHRQRLVSATNATMIGPNDTAPILALDRGSPEIHRNNNFHHAAFAAGHTDFGFTETMACIPNCSFYDSTFSMLNKTSFTQTFASKYLIHVDGMSFSGRWRALLQSRSLGLKATIFREWYDSRLFAWRHFVPMDNRFDDLWSLLTYLIGYRDESAGVEVARHDYEAYRIAKQGKEWAEKVLRREDREVYLFRLLLEYGRIIDDQRERIGVVGDGGQEMREFDRRVPAVR